MRSLKGSDDGFEFFGGSVNVRNLVSVNCSDDSFDWTEGWNGTGTNLVAYQEAEKSLGYDCDCLIEADNNENNYAATPVSHPVLSNLILVGNGGSKQGVLIRRGSHVTISDALIGGKAEALKIESNETDESLADRDSEFINVAISSDFINNSEQKKYTDSQFVADGNSTGAEIPYSNLNEIISACPWMQGWTR